MDTKYAAGIVIVIILAIGAYALWGTKPAAAPTDTAVDETPIPTDLGGSIGTTDTTVTYTDQGFSPASVTIKKGQSVTFVNQSTHGMWIGSDEHPSHTEYDGTSRTEHCAGGTSTSFDQCGTGDSYTFVFDKVGTWDYHNHVAARDEGTVTVTE